MSSQYDALIATRGKLPLQANAMSDLLTVYRLDWSQYSAVVTVDTNGIEQCDLGYNDLIISQMLIINAILPTLRESLDQEISFRHQDVIPDEPAQVVAMITKQDEENKEGPKNDKSSKTKEIS